MSEVMYFIRRKDGGDIGDYHFVGVEEGDWSPAEDYADFYDDEPLEFEMVKATLEVVETRTLPQCRECDAPAEFWGLCETHAREDDPSAFDEP